MKNRRNDTRHLTTLTVSHRGDRGAGGSTPIKTMAQQGGRSLTGSPARGRPAVPQKSTLHLGDGDVVHRILKLVRAPAPALGQTEDNSNDGDHHQNDAQAEDEHEASKMTLTAHPIPALGAQAARNARQRGRNKHHRRGGVGLRSSAVLGPCGCECLPKHKLVGTCRVQWSYAAPSTKPKSPSPSKGSTKRTGGGKTAGRSRTQAKNKRSSASSTSSFPSSSSRKAASPTIGTKTRASGRRRRPGSASSSGQTGEDLHASPSGSGPTWVIAEVAIARRRGTWTPATGHGIVAADSQQHGPSPSVGPSPSGGCADWRASDTAGTAGGESGIFHEGWYHVDLSGSVCKQQDATVCLQGLLPGLTYYVRLSVCQATGSNATTSHEDHGDGSVRHYRNAGVRVLAVDTHTVCTRPCRITNLHVATLAPASASLTFSYETHALAEANFQDSESFLVEQGVMKTLRSCRCLLQRFVFCTPPPSTLSTTGPESPLAQAEAMGEWQDVATSAPGSTALVVKGMGSGARCFVRAVPVTEQGRRDMDSATDPLILAFPPSAPRVSVDSIACSEVELRLAAAGSSVRRAALGYGSDADADADGGEDAEQGDTQPGAEVSDSRNFEEQFWKRFDTAVFRTTELDLTAQPDAFLQLLFQELGVAGPSFAPETSTEGGHAAAASHAAPVAAGVTSWCIETTLRYLANGYQRTPAPGRDGSASGAPVSAQIAQGTVAHESASRVDEHSAPTSTAGSWSVQRWWKEADSVFVTFVGGGAPALLLSNAAALASWAELHRRRQARSSRGTAAVHRRGSLRHVAAATWKKAYQQQAHRQQRQFQRGSEKTTNRDSISSGSLAQLDNAAGAADSPGSARFRPWYSQGGATSVVYASARAFHDADNDQGQKLLPQKKSSAHCRLGSLEPNTHYRVVVSLMRPGFVSPPCREIEVVTAPADHSTQLYRHDRDVPRYFDSDGRRLFSAETSLVRKRGRKQGLRSALSSPRRSMRLLRLRQESESHHSFLATEDNVLLCTEVGKSWVRLAWLPLLAGTHSYSIEMRRALQSLEEEAAQCRDSNKSGGENSSINLSGPHAKLGKDLWGTPTGRVRSLDASASTRLVEHSTVRPHQWREVLRVEACVAADGSRGDDCASPTHACLMARCAGMVQHLEESMLYEFRVRARNYRGTLARRGSESLLVRTMTAASQPVMSLESGSSSSGAKLPRHFAEPDRLQGQASPDLAARPPSTFQTRAAPPASFQFRRCDVDVVVGDQIWFVEYAQSRTWAQQHEHDAVRSGLRVVAATVVGESFQPPASMQRVAAANGVAPPFTCDNGGKTALDLSAVLAASSGIHFAEWNCHFVPHTIRGLLLEVLFSFPISTSNGRNGSPKRTATATLPKPGELIARFCRIDVDISSSVHQAKGITSSIVEWKDVLQRPSCEPLRATDGSRDSPPCDRLGNTCGIWRRAWPAEEALGTQLVGAEAEHLSQPVFSLGRPGATSKTPVALSAARKSIARWNFASQLRMRHRWVRHQSLRCGSLAALCLQTWWRCCQQTRILARVVRRRLSAQAIQRTFRMHWLGQRVLWLQAFCRLVPPRLAFLRLAHAAAVIQRSGVVKEVNHRTARRRASAIVMQCAWRSATGCRAAAQLQLRRGRLALLLQVHTRRFLACRKMDARKNVVRAEAAAAEAERMKIHNAHLAWLGGFATIIQCAVRVHQARQSLHFRRRATEAAIRLQSHAFRIPKAKSELAARRLRYLKSCCAIRIQAQCRGFLVRQATGRLRAHQALAATSIQRVIGRGVQGRAMAARERSRLETSAVVAQNAFRGYVSRRLLRSKQRTLRAAHVLQQTVRCHLARVRLESLRHSESSAIVIQAMVRQYAGKQHLRQLQREMDCIKAVQATIRMRLARKAFLAERDRMGRPAILLQSLCRRYLARRRTNVLRQRDAAGATIARFMRIAVARAARFRMLGQVAAPLQRIARRWALRRIIRSEAAFVKRVFGKSLGKTVDAETKGTHGIEDTNDKPKDHNHETISLDGSSEVCAPSLGARARAVVKDGYYPLFLDFCVPFSFDTAVPDNQNPFITFGSRSSDGDTSSESDSNSSDDSSDSESSSQSGSVSGARKGSRRDKLRRRRKRRKRHKKAKQQLAPDKRAKLLRRKAKAMRSARRACLRPSSSASADGHVLGYGLNASFANPLGTGSRQDRQRLQGVMLCAFDRPSYDLSALGPAEAMGLQLLDVVVEASGEPVSSVDDLQEKLAQRWPSPMHLRVLRLVPKDQRCLQNQRLANFRRMVHLLKLPERERAARKVTRFLERCARAGQVRRYFQSMVETCKRNVLDSESRAKELRTALEKAAKEEKGKLARTKLVSSENDVTESVELETTPELQSLQDEAAMVKGILKDIRTYLAQFASRKIVPNEDDHQRGTDDEKQEDVDFQTASIDLGGAVALSLTFELCRVRVGAG